MILDLKGMRAKVSKKNVILSTKRKHGQELAKYYAKKGVSTSVKSSAKYLGLGQQGEYVEPLLPLTTELGRPDLGTTR